MKYLNLLILLLALGFSGCEQAGNQPEVPVLEGRDPEVVIWVSGQQWIPSTIGMVIFRGEDYNLLYLEASSRIDRGYKRVMKLSTSDSFIDWPPADTLDLLETEMPATIEAIYEQFRDKENSASTKWRAFGNEFGGIRIDKAEEEEGVQYATGEFFMKPYVFIDRPNTQEISGLFNNIRVFDNGDSLEAYFSKVRMIEAANGN